MLRKQQINFLQNYDRLFATEVGLDSLLSRVLGNQIISWLNVGYFLDVILGAGIIRVRHHISLGGWN
jgi:lipid-binding SYLF domain-containing protein